MNEPTTTRFSNSGEVEQISEYRRFNLLAVLAALLGIGSWSVLISSFLVIVPLLAIFLGICGLVAWRRQQDLGGRWPAWGGIVLSLFFLSWSASHVAMNRCVDYSQAYNVVENWLHLVVQGEREIAHQAMMSVTRRQAAGLSVDEYYSMDKEARKAMEDVFSEAPMSELIGFGKDSKIELLKNVSIKRDLEYSYMEQIYRVTPESGDVRHLKVTAIRESTPAMAQPGWIISGAVDVKGSGLSIFESLSRFVTLMLAG